MHIQMFYISSNRMILNRNKVQNNLCCIKFQTDNWFHEISIQMKGLMCIPIYIQCRKYHPCFHFSMPLQLVVYILINLIVGWFEVIPFLYRILKWYTSIILKHKNVIIWNLIIHGSLFRNYFLVFSYDH